MKDLSLFPDENAKKQEERSALSSSPLQAKFKKTRRKSALTTISAEDEMRRVNGMWELKKVMQHYSPSRQRITTNGLRRWKKGNWHTKRNSPVYVTRQPSTSAYRLRTARTLFLRHSSTYAPRETIPAYTTPMSSSDCGTR